MGYSTYSNIDDLLLDAAKDHADYMQRQECQIIDPETGDTYEVSVDSNGDYILINIESGDILNPTPEYLLDIIYSIFDPE